MKNILKLEFEELENVFTTCHQEICILVQSLI